MKKYLSLLVLCLFVMPAFGAGRSMVGNIRPAAGVGVARTSSVATSGTPGGTVANTTATNTTTSTTTADTAKTSAAEDNTKSGAKTAQEQAKMACLSNNIGVGNTFVWAARNSNTSNYATMVEDTENPNNNVCFVLVGMRSEDPRVNTSDIQPQYFEWGRNITCGSWVDEGKLKDRILEAKKKARVWGTIGASVGGAGLGVGAMELFGNKLIGGKVQGQDAYEKDSTEWFTAKANELKRKNATEYNDFKKLVLELQKECKKETPNARCNEKKFKALSAMTFTD